MNLYCYHCLTEFNIKNTQAFSDCFIRVPYRIVTLENYGKFVDEIKSHCVSELNNKGSFTERVSLSDISSYQIKSLTFLHAVNEKSVN